VAPFRGHVRMNLEHDLAVLSPFCHPRRRPRRTGASREPRASYALRWSWMTSHGRSICAPWPFSGLAKGTLLLVVDNTRGQSGA